MPVCQGPGQRGIEEGAVRPGEIAEVEARPLRRQAFQQGFFRPPRPRQHRNPRRDSHGGMPGQEAALLCQEKDLRDAGEMPDPFQGQVQGISAGKHRLQGLRRQGTRKQYRKGIHTTHSIGVSGGELRGFTQGLRV